MIEVKINKQKLDRLNRSLKKLANGAVTDMRPVFRESAALIEQESKDNFARQGFLYGQAWTPLAASTRRQRARLGYGPARPILVRRGNLRDSVRTVKATSQEAVVRNVSPIAKYHQGPGPRRKLPERVILTATERSEKAIRQLFENAIAKLLASL